MWVMVVNEGVGTRERIRNLSVASRHGETGVNYRSALRQLHGLWEAFGFCRPQFFKL